MGIEGMESEDAKRLLAAIVELSHLRDIEHVTATVRRAARELTGADGVTFVLREGDKVFYADEEAIGPLWKGQRFDAKACISGWAILHRESVVIEDIYADARVPHDAYRPTFVKSLAMVPIRRDDPIGAIGAYWAKPHRATAREVTLIEALASAAATAVHNAELLADARRAARVREEFLAIASHELRTPLTALLLETEMLERQLRAQGSSELDKVSAGLKRIHEREERMHSMIEHLLHATETIRGQLVLVIGKFDLAALVRRCAREQELTAARAGSSLRVDAPASLVIEGDEARLQIAIANLLSNAIKFGNKRPIVVSVETSPGGRVRVLVRDEGIGIPATEQKRIFDPFERAVSTRNYGGFGVGLWAARKMVEAHGGRIVVMSAPGEGSLFVVELRSAPPAPAAA